jgi:hypothetical protein
LAHNGINVSFSFMVVVRQPAAINATDMPLRRRPAKRAESPDFKGKRENSAAAQKSPIRVPVQLLHRRSAAGARPKTGYFFFAASGASSRP